MFIAQPPLYSVKEGKKITWLYSDEKLAEFMKKKGVDAKDLEVSDIDEEGNEIATEDVKKAKKKFNVQRYKGLGEMNPDQLWETTMNPETRLMKQVTVEDAEAASEIFDILMGSEVAPRKKFIQTNAKSVKNLDI